jgi:hypothetical protein
MRSKVRVLNKTFIHLTKILVLITETIVIRNWNVKKTVIVIANRFDTISITKLKDDFLDPT